MKQRPRRSDWQNKDLMSLTSLAHTSAAFSFLLMQTVIICPFIPPFHQHGAAAFLVCVSVCECVWRKKSEL